MAEQQGSSPMFAIFVLSLLSLALFPYTIYLFCNAGDAEEGVVKPWQVRPCSWTLQNLSVVMASECFARSRLLPCLG